MKKYNIRYLDAAKKDILELNATGNKSLIRKLNKLLHELELHPETGTGKPEYLKYEKYWSRRINKEHRLCYEIYDDVVVVLVLSAFGHYDDK
jgi:toxin YoeB